ncbi:hypothetical protein KIPB_012473, partial [Kipferlia bialata]
VSLASTSIGDPVSVALAQALMERQGPKLGRALCGRMPMQGISLAGMLAQQRSQAPPSPASLPVTVRQMVAKPWPLARSKRPRGREVELSFPHTDRKRRQVQH